MASQKQIEQTLLKTLDKESRIQDSRKWAQEQGFPHDDSLVGTIKSLESLQVIKTLILEHKSWNLTKEGEIVAKEGSAEARTFNAVPPEGITKSELEKKIGADVIKIGFSQAMKSQWIAFDKSSGKVLKKKDSIQDVTKENLVAIQNASTSLEPKILETLKKRKLITPSTLKSFVISKGDHFTLNPKKPAADLSSEMIANKSWKNEQFKEYNFNAKGVELSGGYLHPLLKVRAEFRKIFLELGFEEMPTNNFVESSFWNFDSLFQPQQHPARDAHDTFFLSDPKHAQYFPEDYLDKVKTMHEKGGYDSIGYRYDWKLEESAKNILRTHTTAVSSRMLYKLAQDGFKPKKYFSIDRVFRNESLDATHLAEFHQIEGLVADYDLNLGHLMGVIAQFFEKLGLTNIRFKPAYNPYTEPSMEIFSYHEGLKKWVEVGNSGVFRPEMLRPMGLPENVSVIAWGLSLERPTMIKYGIKNIRDLCGHKLSLDFVKSNPICRLDK